MSLHLVRSNFLDKQTFNGPDIATDICDPGIFICDVVKTYSDTCRNCGPGENYNGVRKSQAYKDLAQTLHWRPTLQRSCGTVVTFECGSSAIICLEIFNGERPEELLENGRQIVFQYSGEISLPLITHNYSHIEIAAQVSQKNSQTFGLPFIASSEQRYSYTTSNTII